MSSDSSTSFAAFFKLTGSVSTFSSFSSPHFAFLISSDHRPLQILFSLLLQFLEVDGLDDADISALTLITVHFAQVCDSTISSKASSWCQVSHCSPWDRSAVSIENGDPHARIHSD